LIRNGDEIHEVNGIPVKGRNIEQVVQILVRAQFFLLVCISYI